MAYFDVIWYFFFFLVILIWLDCMFYDNPYDILNSNMFITDLKEMNTEVKLAKGKCIFENQFKGC